MELVSLFFLDKNCVYLDAECLCDHIKGETVQTCALLRLSARWSEEMLSGYMSVKSNFLVLSAVILCS